MTEAFNRAGPFPEQEVTPPLLIDAVTQCLDIAARSAEPGALAAADVDEIGTHALECITDLSLWAYQLGLQAERNTIEDLAFDFARWIARNDGAISVLEPVVNTFARRANSTHDPADLVLLFDAIREVLAHVAPQLRNGLEAGNPAQPWRILNFNGAIIATRSQQPELMCAAFDLLEQNLPDECAAFYEEGARQAEKQVYAQHVRDIMRERFVKWTTRH
ncbi:MAG: hypothetical protein AABZ67_13490 [Pseudomonadota bacterium]